MHIAPRLSPGDPLAFAAGRGNAPIQRCGQFQRYPRSPILQPAKKSAMRQQSLLRLAASADLNSCRLELSNSLAADPGIWVRNRHDAARNPCGNQGLSTGRRGAMMSTGL